MGSSDKIRTRAQRVASRVDYNGLTKKCKQFLSENEGGRKLLLMVALAFVISIVSGAWNQPLRFKLYSSPDRNITSVLDFSGLDMERTNADREVARNAALRYYEHDPAKIVEYKNLLRQEMSALVSASNLAGQPKLRNILRRYLPENLSDAEEEAALRKAQEYFEEDVELVNYAASLDKVFVKFEKEGISSFSPSSSGKEQRARRVDASRAEERIVLHGMIKLFQATPERNVVKELVPARAFKPGNRQQAIENGRRLIKEIDERLRVEIVAASTVAFGSGAAVRAEINRVFAQDVQIADMLARRVAFQPPDTLTEVGFLSNMSEWQAELEVKDYYKDFDYGESIVEANSVVDANKYNWLKTEREIYLKTARGAMERFSRWFAMFALLSLLLCSAYVFTTLRSTNEAINVRALSLKETAYYLGFFALFYAIGRILQIAWPDQGALTEIVPLLMFVELTTFALSWSLALSVGVIMSFALTISNGAGFEVFIVFCGASLFVAFLSRTIHTRLQLVTHALLTGIFVFLLACLAGFLSNDAMRPVDDFDLFPSDAKRIVLVALYRGFWALGAGVLTTCLFPFAEVYFHIVTPMQLLEYANPSHPLMLELNRRAPATYSHSIQTSTLAEAAAEAIGARAYLAKVGAFFHDVGKMLNPDYFTENQNGHNIHDELEPRMSSLVIVAHVKDGVDLGRRYNLPQQIIDLIEQHHGTMLVGFFYAKALKAAKENDPDAKLDESPFRYPGPIPQTKEAGILMLADATESASRSLTDWSPRRVESLVRKITEARIEDGQFRDSGLTFGEIQTIQQSLVKSLLASRHSRVKYDDDQDSKEPRPEESRIVKLESRMESDSTIRRKDAGPM